MKFNETRDMIIINHVSSSPFNLQKAFKNAAMDIGFCKYQQIQNRWYSYLRFQESVYTVKSKYVKASNIKRVTTQSKHFNIKSEQINIQYIIPFKE